MDEQEQRVLQIVRAAPGWRAVFIDARTELVTEDIACWGLVEYGDGREVHPLISCGAAIDDASAAGNYCGVIGPNGDPESLREIAETVVKRNGHAES